MSVPDGSLVRRVDALSAEYSAANARMARAIHDADRAGEPLMGAYEELLEAVGQDCGAADAALADGGDANRHYTMFQRAMLELGPNTAADSAAGRTVLYPAALGRRPKRALSCRHGCCC